MDLDDSDRRILWALQAQPELTMRELADVTGLSHSPCWRRLQRLQAEVPSRLAVSSSTPRRWAMKFWPSVS